MDTEFSLVCFPGKPSTVHVKIQSSDNNESLAFSHSTCTTSLLSWVSLLQLKVDSITLTANKEVLHWRKAGQSEASPTHAAAANWLSCWIYVDHSSKNCFSSSWPQVALAHSPSLKKLADGWQGNTGCCTTQPICPQTHPKRWSISLKTLHAWKGSTATSLRCAHPPIHLASCLIVPAPPHTPAPPKLFVPQEIWLKVLHVPSH